MLKELIDDIADSWYSLLVDETTDNSTIKHMAVLVKYYSFTQTKSIIDFLGLLCTPKTTHDVLHRALVEFMDKVGLRKDRCMGLGCDGALNLCVAHHSLFALLKKDCPNLHLVKCICHGLDKCASKASVALPGTLEDLVRDSRGWFSNSACRKFEYQREYEVGISFFYSFFLNRLLGVIAVRPSAACIFLYKHTFIFFYYFQALTGLGEPPQLVKVGNTRWLSWYGAVKSYTAQYDQLAAHFKSVAEKDPKRKTPLAHTLSAYLEDKSHLLYLNFLRPILKEAASMNVTFQKSLGDFAQVYTDLKTYVFSMAERIIKPEALVQGQPGTMLRLSELQALKLALQRSGSFKDVHMVDYGSNFYRVQAEIRLPEERLREVQKCCADFLVKYVFELTERLPALKRSRSYGSFLQLWP